MRKTLLFALLVTLLLKVVVANTVVPDSLLGTYVGERWFKDWEICDTCWILSTDTFTIKKINVEYCYSWVYGNIIPSIAIFSEIFNTGTEYDFCTEINTNWRDNWIKFCSVDSAIINIYAISMPPPNTHAYGFRFYGKRISSEFLSAPEVKAVSRLVNIASVGEEIIVETNNSETGNLQLMDLSGRVLHQSKIWSTRTVICAPSTGVLIYRFVNSKGEVQSGKIAVN